MKGIQNIIFDLGGVILNIDYNRTEKAFVELGIRDFRKLYTQFHASNLFEDLETGRISPAEFINALQQESSQPISAQQITDAWNAMLLDFPVERLRLLQQLRNQYEIFLLSNTNAIHLEAFGKILLESRGIPSLGVIFEKTYYSHLMGLRKPDKAIYERVLEENGLKPGETLFIDDSPQNITGAQLTGMKTLLLEPPKTILDIFRAEG